MAFKNVSKIDKDTENILNILLEHYYSYDKGFFNYKIKNYLIKYKNEIFAIKREKTRNRLVVRYSSKNNLLKLFFYSI